MYCYQIQRKCADLLPQIELWLNQTGDSCTVYGAVEFIVNAQKPDILAKILPELRYSTVNEKL
jgi:hypothetical protein